MLKKVKNWLRTRLADDDIPERESPKAARPVTARPKPPRPAAAPAVKPPAGTRRPPGPAVQSSGTIESTGPGKNVLIRNKYVREDTGTHETLKILDDSLVDSGEETGIDPYNTGSFDRSKNWNNRFHRK